MSSYRQLLGIGSSVGPYGDLLVSVKWQGIKKIIATVALSLSDHISEHIV